MNPWNWPGASENLKFEISNLKLQIGISETQVAISSDQLHVPSHFVSTQSKRITSLPVGRQVTDRLSPVTSMISGHRHVHRRP